ncbi:MAG: hypothetical protein OEV08_09720 [Nitrospira sp.]|nr:hypothetical protein [Nitrospira sp.]
MDAKKISLILHEEKTEYSIGEPIRPKLQILNKTSWKAEIGNGFIFDWERLGFSNPNCVHLIGPDGADLAIPYNRDKSYFNTINPISVDAGREEWLFLPVYAHLHLRKIGKYSFWLELLDNTGELHHSNRISFQLVSIEASVPTEFIELTLTSRKSSFAATESIDVEAIFANKHDAPITFLNPQVDSFYGWVNPVYQFTVVDDDGRSLALHSRCGNMAIPRYDDTTQFTVKPGEFHAQTLSLPSFSEMQNPGEYHVRLTYIVRDKAIGKGGVVLGKQLNWRADVFVGLLESNESKLIRT